MSKRVMGSGHRAVNKTQVILSLQELAVRSSSLGVSGMILFEHSGNSVWRADTCIYIWDMGVTWSADRFFSYPDSSTYQVWEFRQASHLNFLCLSFLICKVWQWMVHILLDHEKVQWENNIKYAKLGTKDQVFNIIITPKKVHKVKIQV